MKEDDIGPVVAPHVPVLLQVCVRDMWLCRLIPTELLHGVLYPDKHIAPLLYQAVLAHETPLNTKVDLLKVITAILHPSLTPVDGFKEFVKVVAGTPLKFTETAMEGEKEEADVIGDTCEGSVVSCLLSSATRILPKNLQENVFLLAEAMLARDEDLAKAVVKEANFERGASIFEGENKRTYKVWHELHTYLRYGHPDVQAAIIRVVLMLFWQCDVKSKAQSYDLLLAITKDKGQTAGQFWFFPQLVRMLGHKSDPVVEDVLTLLEPMVRSLEDLRGEFQMTEEGGEEQEVDEEDETAEKRLERLAKEMLADGERAKVLKDTITNEKYGVGPKFIIKAMDWKSSVRDFVLGILLTEKVLTELSTTALANDFWDVIIHLLRFSGVSGQRWVSETLKQLARFGRKNAAQDFDFKVVEGVCSPRVITPLVAHIAGGTLLSASKVAKHQSIALAEVPDALLSLLTLLPEKRQIEMLAETLTSLLHITPTEGDERFDKGVNQRTSDAIRVWVARCLLIFFSAGLVRELERHYPNDAPFETEQTTDNRGTAKRRRAPLPVMVPGAMASKATLFFKKSYEYGYLNQQRKSRMFAGSYQH
jgi:hypothetical protein